MEAPHKPGILFRFRRPSSVPERQPSRAMAEALRHLSESEEMRPFVAKAHAQSRDVVVEVFHASDGRPLLVHTTTTPRREAYEGTGAAAGTMPPL